LPGRSRPPRARLTRGIGQTEPDLLVARDCLE